MTARHWTDHEARLAAGQACLDAALHLYLPLGLSVTCCCDPDHVAVGPQHGNTCTSPGKAPIHPWKHLQTTLPTADEVQQRWRYFPYGNVGCVLGQVSGLVRVDVDGPEGEALLAQWSAGDLPLTWTFRSSPVGRGVLYGWPRDLPCHSTAQASPGAHKELRLMANGSQTVLPPSRHPSGRLYAWEPGRSPQEIPLAAAPPWLVERLRPAPRQPTPRQTGHGSEAPDSTRVAAALFAIPNDDAAYDDWLTIGMALHSTGAPWARELWDTWSRQSGKYDEGKQEKSWASFHQEGSVTIASLFSLACQAGWRPLQGPRVRRVRHLRTTLPRIVQTRWRNA